MRSFKQATRVFWTGWEYIGDYLGAVKNHGWEVLWGAGVIGLPFTLVTLNWIPSWWSAFGYVIALIVAVSGYHLWRDYHLRLQPKLQVTRVIPQTWRTKGIFYEKFP